jgi:hypothetical protein
MLQGNRASFFSGGESVTHDEFAAALARSVDGLHFDEARHSYSTASGLALQSVTQVLKEYRLSPDYGAIPDAVLQKAATRGNEWHDQILRGDPTQHPPLDRFLSTRPVGGLLAEVPLVDVHAGVAGRADLIVTECAPGLHTLCGIHVIDLKHTAMPHFGHAIQTAAYIGMIKPHAGEVPIYGYVMYQSGDSYALALKSHDVWRTVAALRNIHRLKTPIFMQMM